jgi:hypothetical protein
MNEKIKQLADEADGVFIHKLITGAKQYTFLEKDLEKFAELIVRDCRDMFVVNSVSWNLLNEKLEHFGVEE